MIFDFDGFREKLTEACDRYEKTAPTVCDHCNDLFIRLGEAMDQVTLGEIYGVAYLWGDGDWFQPNYAANHIYHLRHRLGMDVVGQAGY